MMHIGSWCWIHDVKLSRDLGWHKQILQQLKGFPFGENFFIKIPITLGKAKWKVQVNSSEICKAIH